MVGLNIASHIPKSHNYALLNRSGLRIVSYWSIKTVGYVVDKSRGTTLHSRSKSILLLSKLIVNQIINEYFNLFCIIKLVNTLIQIIRSCKRKNIEGKT